MDTRMSVISERKLWFQHAECDFYTQMSVISTRSVILTRKNVISTLTTCTRVISTRRVGCWHVWVWLWHSRKWLWNAYVSNPHSACRNHFCVWCSHVFCDEHTHKCNFWTQRVISTRTSVISTRSWKCWKRTNVNMMLTTGEKFLKSPSHATLGFRLGWIFYGQSFLCGKLISRVLRLCDQFIQIWNLGWHFWLFLDDFKKYSTTVISTRTRVYSRAEYDFDTYVWVWLRVEFKLHTCDFKTRANLN
jgi:hypothetical protein